MLAEHPDALVLAGGTDLMVDVNEGHRPIGRDDVVVVRQPRPRAALVDPRPGAGTLRLGAAVTYAELAAPPLAGLVPALAQAARTVGSPQIRNAATIGGNVVTCSPAGDGLPGARRRGRRRRAGERRRCAAAPDRRVHGRCQADGADARTSCSPPSPCRCSTAGRATPRSACATPWSSPSPARASPSTGRPGRCASPSVRSPRRSCGRPRPRRSPPTRSTGTARSIGADAVAEFGRLAAAASSPIDDHRSTAAYRRHSIDVLARRLLRRAFTVSGSEVIPA